MPGRSAAPSTASAAKPTPPAAPAPGSPRPVGTGRAAHQLGPAGQRGRPAGRRRPGSAPFCGPYTAAAPRSPSSGLSTSPATTTSTSGQSRVQAREVQGRGARERGAAGRHLGPAVVEDPGAEGLEQPGTAVGAGAAADAQNQLAAAVADRGRHQLAGAAAAGRQRGRHTARQQGQPGGLGQLDDGGVALPGVRRRHRFAGRSADGDRHLLEPRGDGSGEGALAAVGHGQRKDVQVGAGPQDACADGRGHLRGRQRPLEGVGRDEHGGHERQSSTRAAVPRRVSWRQR